MVNSAFLWFLRFWSVAVNSVYKLQFLHIYSFFMVALCNRADHYIFALWFLSSSSFFFFFSSPNLSGRRLDVYHTSFHTWCGLSANLRCRSETCCTCLARNAGRKKAPSHNFVGLYLRNWGTYRQSEKNLLSSNTSFTCPYNMANFGPLVAEILSLVWGTPANFNGFRVLAVLLNGI